MTSVPDGPIPGTRKDETKIPIPQPPNLWEAEGRQQRRHEVTVLSVDSKLSTCKVNKAKYKNKYRHTHKMPYIL